MTDYEILLDEEMRRVLKNLPEMPASFDSPEETNMMRIPLEEQNPLTVRMMNEEEIRKYGPPVLQRCEKCGKEKLLAQFARTGARRWRKTICKQCEGERA